MVGSERDRWRGNSANYATGSQNAGGDAVTAYVEHAIARCSVPTQQLFNDQLHDEHDMTMI